MKQIHEKCTITITTLCKLSIATFLKSKLFIMVELGKTTIQPNSVTFTKVCVPCVQAYKCA